ncbi:MAG: MFS transporter [Gammaproteobacteria bacterium]|nr:MFS transporter [Gammaproteobacteria bacterium]
MSGFQILTDALCFMINMLDGFDVLVMAFTAHSISTEWSLNGKSLGLLFSSGLVGMALGAIFLGRLADIYGRRVLIIACLLIITTGMLISAFTQNMYQLAAMRIFTGLGIGGALATMNILTSEYSSRRRRGLNISILQSGYPIGGIAGGAIAASLIPVSGWQSVFIFGAGLSAIMIPLVFWKLPESIDYILVRRPDDALQRINSLLLKMNHEPLGSLADSDRTPQISAGVLSLWQPQHRKATILIWLGFFLVMASLYFVLSWTPKLLVLAGQSENQGISGGMLLQLGGIAGQFVLGFTSVRFGLKKLAGYYMFLSALLMTLFALYSGDLQLATIIGFSVGFFLFGAITCFYILGPALYPPEIRTTGMGWAIGVGRIGAILSPATTGVLLDMGWQSSSLYYVFAVPMLIAMLAILLIKTS